MPFCGDKPQGLRPPPCSPSYFVSQRTEPCLTFYGRWRGLSTQAAGPDASLSRDAGTQKTPESFAGSMTNFEPFAAPSLSEAWMRKLFQPPFSEENLNLIFISPLNWSLTAAWGVTFLVLTTTSGTPSPTCLPPPTLRVALVNSFGRWNQPTLRNKATDHCTKLVAGWVRTGFHFSHDVLSLRSQGPSSFLVSASGAMIQLFYWGGIQLLMFYMVA